MNVPNLSKHIGYTHSRILLTTSGQASVRYMWGTPLIRIANPRHNRVKARLIEYCYTRMRVEGDGISSGVAPTCKINLYESAFDFFSSDSDVVSELRTFCQDVLGQSLTALAAGSDLEVIAAGAKVDLHESWIHITRDGGYHGPHIHCNCSWCGIYYLESGDCDQCTGNGATEFFTPFNSTYDDLGTRVCSLGSLRVTPNEGTLLLFPSYLPHAARLYRGGRDRVVIAFNARVFGAPGAAPLSLQGP